MRRTPQITSEWSPAPLSCLLQQFLAIPHHKISLAKKVPLAEKGLGALLEVLILLPQLEDWCLQCRSAEMVLFFFFPPCFFFFFNPGDSEVP